MSCLYPKTVGYQDDGKHLAWSKKSASREFSTFQLPCGKCINCRLNYASMWALRCTHEALMHENSCFITLTYSDPLDRVSKLDYRHFQLFMKKLRKKSTQPISYLVTGEYGEQSQHAHWHALIFGWCPNDKIFKHTNENGNPVYTSETLNETWARGITAFGDITYESASYCARYSLKKLAHGRDDDHDFQPVSRKSNKRPLGITWLEKYHEQMAKQGYVTYSKKGRVIKTALPRYYEKWLLKHKPHLYDTYFKQKLKFMEAAATKSILKKAAYSVAANKKGSYLVTDLEQKRQIARLNLQHKERIK